MKMRNTTTDLEQFLEQLSRDAHPGDRLPPIRDLMRRFGASQMLVQRAFQNLKARGLIASQVGRGTYFRSAGEPDIALASARASAGARSSVRSVLLLRRSISIARGRVLAEGLQRRFTADGHRVLQVSYTDPDHALAVLKGLPRFDACVVQSTFKTITIEVLAALREKCDVLAVDGTALVGTDVEAVGMEWGEPLATAIAHLQQRGHDRIAYATTSHPFLANELARRRFEHLKNTPTGATLQSMLVPHLPDENYEAGLVAMIKASLDDSGRPPFTALVAWGIEDGAKFRALLSDIGLAIPAALSLVLLGRTDLANEHADFFDTVGCRVADQIEYLHRAITARWADPSIPYGVHLIPVATRAGQSIALPALTGPSRARRSRP
jgi:DNA-binding transcriptional regulator YhcF (GntR family)